MSLMYLAAGANHFWHPGTYLKIIPPWLPAPYLFVVWSGVAEILLSLLLLIRRMRKWAALGIILLLIAVFPANIQMALDWWRTDHEYMWISIARLPVQGILVWWAWRVSKYISTNNAKQKRHPDFSG